MAHSSIVVNHTLVPSSVCVYASSRRGRRIFLDQNQKEVERQIGNPAYL